MTARTHDIIAFASLITIATLNPPESLNIHTATLAIVANIIGSLIPDMDQAGNRLWDLTPASDFTGRIGRRIFMGHRSISHSIVGVFIIYKLLQFVLPLVFNSDYINSEVILSSIMIGYISHLASDMVTRDGLPLLFPIKLKFAVPPLASLRVRTGSFVEKFVVFPLVLTYIFWFIFNHQTEIRHLINLI